MSNQLINTVSLPIEIWDHVLSFLPAKSLIVTKKVDRTLYQLSKEHLKVDQHEIKIKELEDKCNEAIEKNTQLNDHLKTFYGRFVNYIKDKDGIIGAIRSIVIWIFPSLQQTIDLQKSLKIEADKSYEYYTQKIHLEGELRNLKDNFIQDRRREDSRNMMWSLFGGKAGYESLKALPPNTDFNRVPADQMSDPIMRFSLPDGRIGFVIRAKYKNEEPLTQTFHEKYTNEGGTWVSQSKYIILFDGLLVTRGKVNEVPFNELKALITTGHYDDNFPLV